MNTKYASYMGYTRCPSLPAMGRPTPPQNTLDEMLVLWKKAHALGHKLTETPPMPAPGTHFVRSCSDCGLTLGIARHPIKGWLTLGAAANAPCDGGDHEHGS